MKRIALLLVLGCYPFIAFAQNEEEEVEQKVIKSDSLFVNKDYIFFEGDTLWIELNELQLLKKLKFDDQKERRYYYWFRRKVYNAYPFAKLASERMLTLNDRLTQIKSKKDKKKYTKIVQDFLEKEFTEKLKKLTRTEGRILLKLIYRQTGITPFELVKEYRSGWNAFWYNTTASLFKLSLKSTYDPALNREDFLIEDILQRAFLNGTLEMQEPAFPIDFLEISRTSTFNVLPDDLK